MCKWWSSRLGLYDCRQRGPRSYGNKTSRTRANSIEAVKGEMSQREKEAAERRRSEQALKLEECDFCFLINARSSCNGRGGRAAADSVSFPSGCVCVCREVGGMTTRRGKIEPEKGHHLM